VNDHAVCRVKARDFILPNGIASTSGLQFNSVKQGRHPLVVFNDVPTHYISGAWSPGAMIGIVYQANTKARSGVRAI